MAEEKKQAQTPAPKKWSEMTPQERETLRSAFREKLRKYYANRPPRDVIIASRGEEQDE